jgi:hypothetical protein
MKDKVHGIKITLLALMVSIPILNYAQPKEITKSYIIEYCEYINSQVDTIGFLFISNSGRSIEVCDAVYFDYSRTITYLYENECLYANCDNYLIRCAYSYAQRAKKGQTANIFPAEFKEIIPIIERKKPTLEGLQKFIEKNGTE